MTTPPADAVVLIVDDHQANRETLIALLEDGPYRLLEGVDGSDALRLAREQLPDLILLDVMMPGMDGFEVCRRLRADELTAEVPVILVTALHDQAARLTGIDAGADDFITKPFNRAELRARVRTITRLNRYARLNRERARRQEADLTIREQAALIDLDPDAILVVDEDDRVRLWNRGAELLYGRPAVEALGQPLDTMTRPAEVDGHAEAAQSVRNTGSWRGELRQLAGDGTTLTVESRWTRLDADHPRILIVNRDVTRQRLDDEQLRRSQRLGNLGGLASGIVHDLNNVLAPILMATDLLRTGLDDPDAGAWVEMIDTSAKRGAAMVKQILSFVRGSGAGRNALQIRHLIVDMQTLIKQTFPAAIEYETTITADPWLIVAETTQIYQVLLNLAINARDAMPTGGRLRIAADNVIVSDTQASQHAGVAAGPYVRVTVSDTGVGIPADQLARVFDPYFTTKQQGMGTGLGLATVQQVITAHGGFVSLHSEPGRGTEFVIHLPAAEAGPLPQAPADRTAPPHGNGQLIVVADDEAAVREITKATLENFGYRVVVAGDGTEAVARCAAHAGEVALLLTDLQMPHMDGLATIRAVRHMAPKLRVVAVTGSPTDHALTARYDLVIQGVLTKPLSIDTLLIEVDRVLNLSD